VSCAVSRSRTAEHLRVRSCRAELFPGDDRRLDLTDVFAFRSSDDHGKTVLIIDSNPISAPPPIPAPVTGPEFYPGAVYRINIDTDGDAHADIAFTFTFSEYQDGRQTGTAWCATGRVPTDDVYSLRFAWLSNGKIPPRRLGGVTGQWPHRTQGALLSPNVVTYRTENARKAAVRRGQHSLAAYQFRRADQAVL
jgi:hypothetical protein